MHEIVKMNCMANVIQAVKDCFFPDRAEKDEIIRMASEILLENLKDFKLLEDKNREIINEG